MKVAYILRIHQGISKLSVFQEGAWDYRNVAIFSYLPGKKSGAQYLIAVRCSVS
jgi:hypothetical protein